MAVHWQSLSSPQSAPSSPSPKRGTPSQLQLNFISEIFFATLFATRIGPIRLVSVLFDIATGRCFPSRTNSMQAPSIPDGKSLAEQHLAKLTGHATAHFSLPD